MNFLCSSVCWTGVTVGYVAAIKASNACVFEHFIIAYLIVFMNDSSVYIMLFLTIRS